MNPRVLQRANYIGITKFDYYKAKKLEAMV